MAETIKVADGLAVLVRETRCNLEVSRTSKGDYSWTVKLYFADGEESDALSRMQMIDQALRDEYIEK